MGLYHGCTEHERYGDMEKGVRRGDDQLFPVGTDIERGLGIDIKKIQERTINHQRQTTYNESFR